MSVLPDPNERLVDPETGETPPLSPQRFSNMPDAAAKPALETCLKVAELFFALCDAQQPPRRIMPMAEWEAYEAALAEHLESVNAA